MSRRNETTAGNQLSLIVASLPCVMLLACAEDQPVGQVEPALTPLHPFAVLAEADEKWNSWSPDSKWIAYASNRSGSFNIRKKPVAGGEAIQLTHEGEGVTCTAPSWSPDGSRISFSSDRDGAWNIWTMSSSGGDLRQVTSAEDSLRVSGIPQNSGHHDWSPDGKWLAFGRIGGGINLIEAVGGTARPAITGEDGAVAPSWSPDGQEIAFTSERAGQQQIWVARVSDGARRQITDHHGGLPDWSPDGRWLTYSSKRGAEFDTWVIPSTGGESRRITDIHDMYQPQWSPDGRSIAMHQNQTDAIGELWTIAVADGEPRRVATAVVAESRSAWSPDGTEIAFVHRGPGSAIEIWKISASGEGEAVAVTDGAQVKRFWPGVSWSPDGRQLAYGSDAGDRRDIWTVSAMGGAPDRVTLSGGVKEGTPAWSPDGSRILYSSGMALETVPGSGGPTETLFVWKHGLGSPAWSPDGESIAFLTSVNRDGGIIDGEWHTWILTLESGETRWLCDGYGASWSGDGERLCLIRGEFRVDTDIWIVPATGGEPVRLARTPGLIESAPVWSPDGEQILFTTGDMSPASSIYIADVSGMLDIEETR